MFVLLAVAAVLSPANILADAIATVPTMDMGRRSRGDGGVKYTCAMAHADLCRDVHRPAIEPGAAAGELDTALRSACSRMNGDYDVAVDIGLLSDVGLVAVTQRDHASYSVTHSCRTVAGLGGVKVTVDDYWTRYRSLPYSQQRSRLLGPRQDSFEARTTVVGYSPAALQRWTAQRANERREMCRRAEQFSLSEGVQTTSGLVVEIRQRVALVQPTIGAARWLPIEELKLAKPTPC